MIGMLGLRKQVVAQEKWNVELANSTTSLRKQAVKLGRADAEQKEKITSFEKVLTTLLAAHKATEAELEFTLKQMTFVVVDATFQARAELMEEFKTGKHSKWDPNYEIGFLKERRSSWPQIERKVKLLESR